MNYNKEIKDKILNEKDATETRFDHFRLTLTQKMDERIKKEDQIKRVITGIERKMIIIEKKMLETTSSGGGATLHVPISASVSSMDAPTSFNMPSDKADLFTERLDSLQKDFKSLKKKFKAVNEKLAKDVDALQKAVESKAEKEMLLANQKQFFDKLEDITSQTDLKLSLMVSEEMRKVTELFTNNTKLVDKKIAKLYQDLDVEKLNRTIDRKLNRDDAQDKFE